MHRHDVTCLGTDETLNKYERATQESFEAKLNGPRGHGAKDLNEMRVCNRILRVADDWLLYGPDTGHVELMLNDNGLSL